MKNNFTLRISVVNTTTTTAILENDEKKICQIVDINSA